MPPSIAQPHSPRWNLPWGAVIVALGLACGGCFSATAEGLPCTRSESCGPSHECVVGYCREPGFDSRASCGDGKPMAGEYCYFVDPPVRVPVEGAFGRLATGDFNGDGLTDLLVGSSAGAEVHMNIEGEAIGSVELTLTTSFEQLQKMGVELGGGDDLLLEVFPLEVAVADFTGDGRADLVMPVALVSDDELSPATEDLLLELSSVLWLAEIGADGGVPPRPLPETVPFGEVPSLPAGMLTGDFDGDGRPDLLFVVADFDGSAAGELLMNTPGATLSSEPPLVAFVNGRGLPAVGDLNADGVDDIVVTDATSLTTSVLFGPFTDAGPSRAVPLVGSGDPAAVELGDLDDDGRLDILLGTGGEEPTLRVWYGEGSAELVPGESVASKGVSNAVSMAATDLDGDGVAEVLVATNEGLFVHPGYPGRALGAPFLISEEIATMVTVLEFDGHSPPEIVVGLPTALEIHFANP